MAVSSEADLSEVLSALQGRVADRTWGVGAAEATDRG